MEHVGGGSLLQVQSYSTQVSRLVALSGLEMGTRPGYNDDDSVSIGDICSGIVHPCIRPLIRMREILAKRARRCRRNYRFIYY